MISKEQLDALAMRIWEESESECDVRTGREIITSFAHALIKAVEAESEVVAWYDPEEDDCDMAFIWPCTRCPDDPQDTKLIALPMVEEE